MSSHLTLTSTGPVLIGGTSPGRGKSEFIQLVDEQFVSVIRLVLRDSIPDYYADYE